MGHSRSSCSIDDLVGVMTRLLDRVRDVLWNAVGEDLPGLLVGGADRLQAPVLDFQDQQAAARVQHHEVWMGVLRANRHVVPDQVVVVELLLQTLGGSALPLRHSGDA